MTLQFNHFDARLNQWIHTDGNQNNPNSILTEKLDNTLLESYFPGKDFSFGHIDEYSQPEDLQNHPDHHILLLSSKTRLLYGSPECLPDIEKLCPDRKDRGAYGSIFLGDCKHSINLELNVLIVNDANGENGGFIKTWIDEGEKVLNFRSPFLNSNGLCVSTNKLVEDRLAPDGQPLGGIIVVNDEDHKRILARLETNEIAPAETESQRQARDFDGDCIGVALASKYPNFTAEAEYRNQKEFAYAPTVKLKKQSFYREDGTQPPFEEIAIHMSDSISVGIINNQVTALEALESEIEILNTYGNHEQRSEYLDQVSRHYQSLFEQENSSRPKPIRPEYKPYMQEFVALADAPRTDIIIQQAMDMNRLMYRQMIEEGCYQNQIAVDLFKSAKTPEMNLIKENQRYLYRDVNYIKEKKSRSSYLNTGITPKGYSPVELLISQTNKYFQQSQLESRPIVQFQDLFKGVDFTPQQRFAAVAAKHEFDKKFNAAVAMERKRETELGPSALLQTTQGVQLEITNLTRYGHPLIWKAQTINLKAPLKFTTPLQRM
jgi:hypothetical protein